MPSVWLLLPPVAGRDAAEAAVGSGTARPVEVCQVAGGKLPEAAQPSPAVYTPVRMAAVLSAVHAGVGYPCRHH